MIATGIVRSVASALGACAALFALALCPTLAAAQQAGYVHEISGVVSIENATGQSRPAKVGDMFSPDTVFHSGADGKLILKFADGQIVALGVDSTLRIGEYRYSAREPLRSRTALELIRGKMRFVAGMIGATNRDGVQIVAGNSIVSVMKPGGADFIVMVNPNPQEIGAAAVALGQISVSTPYGPIQRIEADQYVPWRPGGTPPPAVPVAAAPAVVQAAVAGLWTTIVPVSTPVTVASAARLAAAVAYVSRAESAAGVDTQHAGYVENVTNGVSMQGPAGKSGRANVGDVFQAGTTFKTGAEGKVVLRFADGQLVVLGPGSTLGVDQYFFDPRDLKSSRSALDLVDGSMRYVSGTIHAENHDGVSISAGASLVDILNTGRADLTVVVDTKGQEVGVAAVTAGDVSVHTPYGPISKVEPGQAAPWQPGQTPPLPEPLAAVAISLQSQIGALTAIALPDNSPVAVSAAAHAATLVAAAQHAEAAAKADPSNAQLRAAAQAAAAQASSATQAADSAAQSVTAAVFASTLATLPATGAGTAQAQLPPPAPALPLPVTPMAPALTPGGGGKCEGSKC